MTNKYRAVSIKVSPNFFRFKFEPIRLKFQKKYGMPIGQVKCSDIIFNNFSITPKKRRKYSI